MSKDQCISDAAQVLATALRELSLTELADAA